jgi:hypothetical protein
MQAHPKEKNQMLLRDAMIVWTPDRDMWKGRPTSGQIAVTSIPEAPPLKVHPMSAGACDHDWQETDDAGRRKLLQRYFTQIIHADGIDENRAREALSVIEDINPAHLSVDKPDLDDET